MADDTAGRTAARILRVCAWAVFVVEVVLLGFTIGYHELTFGEKLASAVGTAAVAAIVWAQIMAFAAAVEALLDIREELRHERWSIPRPPRP